MSKKEGNMQTFLNHKLITTNIIPSNKTSFSCFEEIVEIYTKEGYSVMTQDRVRNHAYRSSICFVIKKLNKKACFVLEIGPGADACLTKMILDNGPLIRYVGLEGNEKSVSLCVKRLKSEYDSKNWQIIRTLSTNPTKIITDFYRTADLLVHELIGLIASREGMVYVLDDVCQRNNGKLPRTIPHSVATFFTPTFINSHTWKPQQIKKVLDYPNILLTHFPFENKTNAPFLPQCALLEYINCSKDQVIDKNKIQTFITSFQVKEQMTINSLTGFIWVGFDGNNRRKSELIPFIQDKHDLTQDMMQCDYNFTTSKFFPPHSNAWPNLVLMFVKD